ncbi:2-phosphosulfolactate phosphatase [Thermophagus xiamenensis]|uniref:Probable 2-phosphosulfolactate phosphatase n=1 Tax=Thermophagus xiamenensis TaxID=385682 RepID=A0A1I2DA33_9BACT|nr:2-phosphosulfolactate phosphatase [Thermophagus xiamenensis]SFE77397.1 2-phosphosulfolactate phosphatase [Thermophagus xiamenensis]
MKHNLEVCFSPALYDLYHRPEAVVVVIDVLRATSAICTAFMNGAKHIIPVGDLEEARAWKAKGHLVAAERDGIVLDFADFGNSPFNFTPERVQQHDIVYSTTNGTKAIHKAASAYAVAIGSYLNLSALSFWLQEQHRDVIILCAAWKDKFSLEDALFAGALSKKLLDSGLFTTICDSVHASLDLWKSAQPNVYRYILKAAQKQRLAKNGLDDVIEFCHTPDQTSIVPVLKGDRLVGETVGKISYI